MRPFQAGIVASLPLFLGYVPAGATFGMLAVASGLSAREALCASLSIFAGASQFALIPALSHSLLHAILIPILLNLRHLAYGFVVAQRVALKNPALSAFGLTDEVFALAQKAEDERFLWGVELGAYAAWVLGTTMGTLGSRLLANIEILVPSFTFSLAGLFLVLLFPRLRGQGILAALAGGAVALSLHIAGHTSWGILLAGAAGPLLVQCTRRRDSR